MCGQTTSLLQVNKSELTPQFFGLETIFFKRDDRFLLNKGCVTTLSKALPFTLKKNLKAKEELWKLKYITMQKNT
jgi:hypothetical protein